MQLTVSVQLSIQLSICLGTRLSKDSCPKGSENQEPPTHKASGVLGRQLVVYLARRWASVSRSLTNRLIQLQPLVVPHAEHT
jgi:hypothetical protein